MKSYTSLLMTGLLAITLSACSDSSDDDADSATGGSVPLDTDTNPPADGAGTGTAGTGTGGTGTAGTGTAGTGTGGTGTGGTDTAGTGTAGTDTGGTGTAGTGTGGTGTGGTDTGGGTTGGAASANPFPLEPAPRPVTPNLPAPQVPVLADPLTPAIPSPNAEDPFGFGLEFDPENEVAGDPPTQPKNLRAEIVSNDWAELNWAPSKDDGSVMQYTLRRDDGVEYIIRGDQTDISEGSQQEIDKYWSTTSFIDCNYTRFAERLHQCTDGRQPQPGQTYVYTVTATDNNGQESAASAPLSVTYLATSNAPVPLYDDFYKDPNDSFVQDHDLSAVDYWLDDNFSLVFQDEFNDAALNLGKWQTRLTWGDETIINGEQQYFVNTQDDPNFGYDPFKFTGSSLVIEAVPVPDELRANLPASCDDPTRPDIDQCEFLSGAISSFDRYQMLYGYTEGRVKVSGGYGALSSFYLYHRYKGTGTSFHAPEIDIIEYLGENPFGAEDAFQTYHYESPGEVKRSSPTMAYKKTDGGNYADGQWHTFGVLWEPQLVIWYIDGREVKRLSGPQVSRRPMNIVFYLVAGSAWAPTPNNPADFPLRFEADYIRVYQRDAFTSTSLYGPAQ
ncbi:MAG: family 16 glycosylhydrolase [Granulosicoccus sp.]|nr:family 16 glycosylhydrolase [Granulosicoccus sp.]